jgi:hypothetical protein
MGVTAKYDAERLMTDIKNKIVANINTKLLEIQTDKAKDATNLVIPDFKKLGGGVLGDAVVSTPEDAIDLMGINAAKMCAYDPYMIIQFAGAGIADVQEMGREIVEIAIIFSLIDPHDYTGEFRMNRYMRAIKELFESMSGFGTGCVSLSSMQILPYLSNPDYWEDNKKRLTWGRGLKFTL